MLHKIYIQRHDCWSRVWECEAETREEAIDKANKLVDEGWEALFPDNDDGEYEECWVEVREDVEVN